MTPTHPNTPMEEADVQDVLPIPVTGMGGCPLVEARALDEELDPAHAQYHQQLRAITAKVQEDHLAH